MSSDREGRPRVEFEIFDPDDREGSPWWHGQPGKGDLPLLQHRARSRRVRAQLAAQRGGADVIFDAKGKRTGGATIAGRGHDRMRDKPAGTTDCRPTPITRPCWKAQQRLKIVAAIKRDGRADAIPDEPLPPMRDWQCSRSRYGMMHWGDLFTARQKLAVSLAVIANSRQSATEATRSSADLVSSRQMRLATSLCRWNQTRLREVEAQFRGRHFPWFGTLPKTYLLGERLADFEVALMVRVAEM